jgi:hypothetical protein
VIEATGFRQERRNANKKGLSQPLDADQAFDEFG